MVNIGDKMVVTKKVTSFLDKGDIIEIMDVGDNGMISFAFGDGFMHKGVMNMAECEEHFEKVVEKKAPSITAERIEKILSCSDIEAYTAFDKCTVVSCKLPNGFVIVEYSACVSPENYDEEMGIDICMNKIENKIWELEGYRLQEELYQNSVMSNCNDCSCCCDDEEDIEIEVETKIEIEEEIEECPCKCTNCDDCFYYAPPCGEKHFCN